MQYTVIVCIDFLFGKPFRNDILDSVFIAHLVEIMKSSPPSLQEKAATVLEFVALTDPTLAPIIFLDIESGLNSAFQQKILKISGKQFLLCNTCCYKYILFSSVWHAFPFLCGRYIKMAKHHYFCFNIYVVFERCEGRGKRCNC